MSQANRSGGKGRDWREWRPPGSHSPSPAGGPEPASIITAIGRVAPSRELREKAVRLVKKVVGPLIVSWSEQPERTDAQVVAMLRAAASEK